MGATCTACCLDCVHRPLLVIRQVVGVGLVGGGAAAVMMDDGTTLHATHKTVDGLERKAESAPLWTGH